MRLLKSKFKAFLSTHTPVSAAFIIDCRYKIYRKNENKGMNKLFFVHFLEAKLFTKDCNNNKKEKYLGGMSTLKLKAHTKNFFGIKKTKK